MSLTGLVFLVAFFTGLGLCLVRHPLFGLYTYVAVFYLHPPSRWWGESLPDLRWALLAAVVTLVASWRLPPTPNRTPWLQTTPAKALILFTVWMWIQNVWALEPALHMEATLLFTKYVLLYYLMYRLIVTPEDMTRFLMVHVVGCGYLGWLAFGVNVSGRLEGVGGPGIDEANAFAMQMGTAIVCGAIFALALGGIWRWLAMLPLPFMLNALILSGSRGGFLALLGGGIVLWLLKPRAYRKMFYVFAGLGVLLFGMLAHDMFWKRMGTMEAAVSEEAEPIDDSAMSRVALVHAQIRMAARYPHGTGHRGTQVLAPEYLENRYLSVGPDGQLGSRSSHNTAMSALVEQGLIGGFVYVWLWWWTFRATLRIKRAEGDTQDTQRRSLLAATAAALTVVFIAGIFVDYIKTEVQIWLWAVLASMLALAEPATAAAGAQSNRLPKFRGRATQALKAPEPDPPSR